MTLHHYIHVQFEPKSALNVDLTEEDFKQEFEKFGNFNKVSLARYSDKQLKGYGFIYFEENDNGEQSAARAVTELATLHIKGVVIMCNFGKRQNQRHKRFAQKRCNAIDMNVGGMDQMNQMGDNMGMIQMMPTNQIDMNQLTDTMNLNNPMMNQMNNTNLNVMNSMGMNPNMILMNQMQQMNMSPLLLRWAMDR
eukprot:7751_1